VLVRRVPIGDRVASRLVEVDFYDVDYIYIVDVRQGGVMHIHVERDIAVPRRRVWAYAADPMTQIDWDRSVAQVVLTSTGPVRVGTTFDTIGPKRSGGRRPGIITSYQVTEFEPEWHAKVEVTNSPTLERAVWSFTFESIPGGATHVVWDIEIVPKLRHAWLALLLRANRWQLVRDMGWFEAALRDEYAAADRKEEP
jgi:hypothetical protein